jgi:uncharacterized membrane protein
VIISWISFTCFFVAALIHIGFFIFEAFLLYKEPVYKSLGYTDQDIQKLRPWAVNQSIYNLALALITFVGLYLIFKKQILLAGAFVSAAGVTMILAGVTLWVTLPRFKKWALVQLLPPTIGFAFLAAHVADRMGL